MGKLSSVFDDLPPPPKEDLNSEQKYQRGRKFSIALNAFAGGYSFLHKFAMPLLMMLFTSRSFHYLDWWWVYHLVLGILLYRKNWDDIWLRGLLIFGLGSGLAQGIASFREYNWHIVSLWMTDAAMLGIIFYLFSISRYVFTLKTKLLFFFLLIPLGFLTQYALFGFTLTVERDHRLHIVKREQLKNYPVLTLSKECGSAGFTLEIVNGKVVLPEVKDLSEILVQECGFEYALGMTKSDINIQNQTSKYLNVKVYYYRDGFWNPFANIPLVEGSSHVLNRQDFEKYPIILFASDSDAKKGMTIVLNDLSILDTLLSQAKDNDLKKVELDRLGIHFGKD